MGEIIIDIRFPLRITKGYFQGYLLGAELFPGRPLYNSDFIIVEKFN